ncbi:MAG: DUF6790 family protein [Acidimicrobiia bacterium]
MTDTTPSAASPRPSAIVMGLTYAVGAAGLFIGFITIGHKPASLTWATLLAVGAGGILSFVRHSLLHRSDAARMGWDLGVRNNFQIEVGIANLAWGVVAVLAVILDWGLAVEAGTFLTFGIYLAACGVMVLFAPKGEHRRDLASLIGILSFGIMLIVLGAMGMHAVG